MGLKKLMVAAALTAAAVVAPATGASAEETYTAAIPTATHIEVVADGPGQPTEITVWATANGSTPEGDIAVTLSQGTTVARTSRALGGAPLLTRTVHFVDTPVTFAGPALPAGRYLATAAFSPTDANMYLPSDALTTFRLGAGGETDPSDDGSGGGLPNTGGPNLMWLLLGGALVVGGASSVAYARRQPVTA